MRIVVVSPFAAERSALHHLLVDDGHDVSVVATTEQGLDVASAAPPAAFIADAQVVGPEGPDVIRALAERGLHPRVILLSPRAGSASVEDRVACLTKPIDLAELRKYLADVHTEEPQPA